MVIVPNLVHAAIPALRLLLPHHPVLVINNGLRAWEREWLRGEFSSLPIVDLLTSSWHGEQVRIGHGDVMCQLANCVEGNFAFIDPDCYVFSPDLVRQVAEASSRHVIAAVFWYRNHSLAFDVPDTFFIGFNRDKYQALCKRYRVEFGITENIPVQLADGFGRKWPACDPHPHPWKPYFDTVHAIALAAAVDEQPLTLIPTQAGDVIHVGGTSYHAGSDLSDAALDPHRLNAHFFHLSLLELQPNARVFAELAALVHHYGSSARLLKQFSSFAQSELCAQTRGLLATLQRRGVI